jgi:hypothetical protein
MNLIVFLIVLIVVILLIFSSHYYSKKRSDALKLMAADMGLTFLDIDEYDIEKRIRVSSLLDLPLIYWGASNVHNVIPGQFDGMDVYLFDFSTQREGSNRRLIKQTAFVAIPTTWKLPEFRFRHDRWYEVKLINRNREGGPHGVINFRPERLKANETLQTALENLTPELNALLDDPRPAQIDCFNGCLLIYKPEVLIHPAAARDFFEHCCAFALSLQSRAERRKVLQWAEIKGEDY